jgi:DNA replication protein DnaC
MSSSTSHDPTPVYCKTCGNEQEQVLRNIPMIGERWTVNACPCQIKEMEDFKRKQENYEKQRRIKDALKISSDIEDIRSMTFKNYRPRPGTEKSLQEVKRSVELFKERGKQGLLLFGETGNGKTHVTAAGANELIDNGYSVVFMTEKDLLSRFNATKNFRNKESFSDIMSACLDCDLLVWDDFMSSQKLTLDEKDWIFQVFNGRERADKPIWATSNMTPEEFKSDEIQYKLDDKGRTWWRIVGNMSCVFNKASNLRKARVMADALDITVEEYEEKYA